MNIAQAKCIPIAEYLAKRGIQPKKTRQSGRELWYQSPIRTNDENPSFKVDTTKNVWYDHGLVEGGSIIDLVTHLCSCNVRDALRHLEGMHLYSSALPKPQTKNHARQSNETAAIKKPVIAGEKEKGSALILVKDSELKHPALLQYLESRKIDPDVARKYLRQIDFKRPESAGTYFGVGFPAGDGFEIRNQLFKGFVGTAKGVSYYGPKNAPVIKVFEGFIDFLSYLSADIKTDPDHGMLILNSTNIWQRALPYLRDPSCVEVRLYLDNDSAGDAATKHLTDACSEVQKVTDMRSRYSDFEDVNAWHLHA